MFFNLKKYSEVKQKLKNDKYVIKYLVFNREAELSEFYTLQSLRPIWQFPAFLPEVQFPAPEPLLWL